MKVLVVGGGGREHAIIRKIRENNTVTEIFALPGNGGIARDATCVPGSAADVEAIVACAKDKAVDFVVVAPDDPLVLGAVDALSEAGIPCFGPNKRAAEIEGSKSFAKDLMAKYRIPTAAYAVFDDLHAALSHLEGCPYPTVVKADGLALGKGVIIAQTKEEARAAVESMMRGDAFGESGRRVVIEECLQGPEVTVLCLTDGETLAPLTASTDHKRARDGDRGPNTGGMGVIAPSPFYTEAVAERCMAEIFLPTLRAMRAEGRPFRGCLYFGVMLTKDGPKVIEYNCRFGDPETEAVLPLLETDLLTLMRAVAEGRLRDVPMKLSEKASCCVMVVSGGYPEAYEKGFPITLPEATEDVYLFSSGAALSRDGTLVTAGGRVIAVTALADTLKAAVQKAYEAAAGVRFEGAYYRRDIGKRALEAME